MDIPVVHPPRLRTGDTLAIVAPASTVDQREDFEAGIAILQQMGFRARYDERIFHSARYLAGDDSSRASELMRAFEDPSVQGVIALRGGYGCSRLVPLLMEKRLRNHPKVFMGFSDLTTLHLLFRRRFGWITFHGPMAASLGGISPQEREHLQALWTDPGYGPALLLERTETLIPGQAEGTLIGGCLSIVAASIGTPYEIHPEGKILFLEDQGEPAYRIDRMLMHLLLAGKLDDLSGVLLGNFPSCDGALDVFREYLLRLDIPALAHFPAGHGSPNWAFALGAKVRLDAGERSIQWLEPAVR